MSDPGLERIRRSPLYEEVAARLRSFIDVQGVKPGDRLLSERELAQRLGVSRTSVRQALTALRVGGLVDIRHGDGVYLLRSPADVGPSLVHALPELPATMEVREALETQTARLAARRRSGADVKELRAARTAMATAIEQGADAAAADRRFHAAVARASRNDLLAGLLDQLTEKIDQTRRASLARPGRPARSLMDHDAIATAIERRDEDAAVRAMRAHLAAVAEVGLPGPDAPR
jgi:GntR family transcriptional regulator, transcriptional repressor for pyruvate dehydrogenase complex